MESINHKAFHFVGGMKWKDHVSYSLVGLSSRSGAIQLQKRPDNRDSV